MAWTYIQSTGELLRPNGEVAFKGYAGHGPGRNNPAMQMIKNVGPIPCGGYTIGPAFTHPKAGKFVLRLTPDPSNEMFGRAGFLIHGDNKDSTASNGCIIAGFSVRNDIDKSLDKRLQVVAYPPSNNSAVQS